jgi:hypothetical protein
VQIAVRPSFDRWANSGDFLCRPLPATQEFFDALMVALKKVQDEKREVPEFVSFDIWPFVRQARRAKRNAQRIARSEERLAAPDGADVAPWHASQPEVALA